MLILLLLLALLPVMASRWARKYKPQSRFTILGLTWGLVVAPFSMGLYATYFIPFVGLPTGLLGLLLTMLHAAPGYSIGIQIGWFESHTVITGSASIPMFILNGLFWAMIYCAIGWWLIDGDAKGSAPNRCKTIL